MAISTRRKLAAAAAGLVVLAGSGGAYAATQKSSAAPPDRAAEQKAFLDDVAGRLHVSPDQLTEALKGAAQDRIDAAVKAGRLTQDQADKVKQRIAQAHGLPLFGGPPIGPGPRGPHLGFGRPGGELGAAAKYLGLTPRKLFSELRGGKSLAEVATDRGKDLNGLKAAMKAAEAARLDAAVKAGSLTDAQRTQIEQDLDRRLDALVNGTGPRFGFRHHP